MCFSHQVLKEIRLNMSIVVTTNSLNRQTDRQYYLLSTLLTCVKYVKRKVIIGGVANVPTGHVLTGFPSRRRNYETIPSMEEVSVVEPLPSTSYSSEHQPPTSQTMGRELDSSEEIFLLIELTHLVL